MYKLIAIDIDGTLITSKGEITERTKLALQKAQDMGIYVVICSGRVSSSTETFAREIGLKDYIIACNGAVVTNLQTGEFEHSNCMDKAKVKQVLKLCIENSINCNLYTLNAVLARKLEHSALFYSIGNRTLPEERRTKIFLYDDLVKCLELPENEYITKITVSDDDKSVFKSIIRKLKDLGDITVLDVSHCSRKVIKEGTVDKEINYYYTEVSNGNVDKWEAIEFLANKLGIKNEEIMTFGDNINDINMVKNAGMGVMMGNAAPDYQKVADYIAPSNDDDGVAKTIEKYVLNME